MYFPSPAGRRRSWSGGMRNAALRSALSLWYWFAGDGNDICFSGPGESSSIGDGAVFPSSLALHIRQV